MNRMLKLTFVISLVLNMLLAGVMLGQLPLRLDRDSPFQQRLESATKHWPEAERASFQRQFKELRSEVQPLREQLREARNETLKAFAAEPFDEAAYDRQASRIGRLRVELGQRMAARMKEFARHLPADRRQALAEAFRNPSSER